MSYPHAETGGVKEGFTMARNRDYDDGDFDQPKRSSPYQDMDGDGPAVAADIGPDPAGLATTMRTNTPLLA